MNILKISARNLSKRFGFRRVFEKLEFELTSPASLAITGPNGSGKSTLLKVISGLLYPNSGKVVITRQGQKLGKDSLRDYLAFVSPEMNFYDELSGLENLKFYVNVSGGSFSKADCLSALDQVGLGGRGNDIIKEYSSGMKMRLKYALALMKQPEILIIDEPSTNLDAEGKEKIYQIMDEQKNKGMLIYATNEESEIGIADRRIRLG
jgi:heme exporter protein A